MKKGRFIAVEGPDGSGKSTVAKLLKEKLEDKGHKVVLTREPGGTEISEKIRELLLDPNNTEMADTTEALLYAAARAQHVEEKIKPLLKEGYTVITDRFYYSSLAYQGFGRDLGLDEIMNLNLFAINGLHPDKVLFFDISPETALKRKYDQGEANRLEDQGETFHNVTYNGYKESIKMYGAEFISIIDANGSIEETLNNCINALNEPVKKEFLNIERKEYYKMGPITSDDRRFLVEQRNLLNEILNLDYYLVSSKPDTRDPGGYYEKEIYATNFNSKMFKDKFKSDENKEIPSYSIEGPLFFSNTKDLLDFLESKKEVGVGRYRTNRKLKLNILKK